MPSRFISLANAIIVCACVCTTLGAVDWRSSAFAEDAEHVVDLRSQSPAEVRIQAQLDATTQVEFLDTPLSDVVDFLEDQHGVPIIVDEQSLLDAGIGTDEPINLRLSKVSLKSALKIMLEPLGLTTLLEDEVMKITTEASANEKISTHVYDVRALRKHEIEADALVELIPSVISPSTWTDETGSIRSLPGVLVVRNTAKVQAQVKELFSQLERLGLSKAPSTQTSSKAAAKPASKVAAN